MPSLDDGRALTRRERLSFTGILAILGIVMVLMNTCCSSPSVVRETRGERIQSELGASIEVVCIDGDMLRHNRIGITSKTGSSTVLSTTEVLTAAHVVRCELPVEGKEPRPVSRLIYVVIGSLRFIADVAAENRSLDVARLRLVGELPWEIRAPVLGPIPKEGEPVCYSYQQPAPAGRYCGKATKQVLAPDGDLEIDIKTKPGNSGSGLYDHHGRLVGVVVQRYFCSTIDAMLEAVQAGLGEVCGGAASTGFRAVLR